MKSIARWAGGVLAVAVGWLAQVQGVVAGGGGAGWTYQLNGNSLWGSGPQCIPTLLGSNLLCSSSEGASHNQGALFLKEAFPVSGVGLSMPLYQFGAISNDGAYPIGQPVLVGPLLYGLTKYGGTSAAGTIYTLNTNTWVETPVHHFTGGATNGLYPEGSLVTSGYMVYGLTWGGGVSNNGTLFSYWAGPILAGQNRFALLHSFSGGTGDGSYPYDRLLLSGSKLYGTTAFGGTNNIGTLFSINTDGSGYAVLHHFTGGTGGANPEGGLTQSGSYLYGTTRAGGATGHGLLFSYYTGIALVGANRLHVLHDFAGTPTDGDYPIGELALSGTNLYGMAFRGGVSNNGTLFRINTGGSGYTNLLQFTGAGSAQASGKNPWRHSLNVFGKYLFGSTYAGGTSDSGTIFRVDLTLDPKLWFQTDAGQLAVWTLNSTGAQVNGGLMENTGAWLVRAAGDIDGDGVADILFQDGSHNMAGWLMNADNTKRSASYWSNTGTWDLKACADFEGTGRAQVLFQQPDGSLALWRLNPDGSYNSSMGLTTSGSAYILRGAGDLDGDGKADLIFQNAAGNLAVWKHNVDGTISGATLPGAGTWLLRAVLDVNGNGISDIIWQAPDGTVAGWFVNAPVTPAGSFSPGGAGSYKVRAGGR